MTRYKIVLVGNTGVGKTTFLTRLLTGVAPQRYKPTIGVDVHPLVFNTNRGHITFDVWDVSGKREGLVHGYYLGAKGCICMNAEWDEEVRKVAGNIPVVTCAINSDSTPFLSLARILTGDKQLEFIP